MAAILIDMSITIKDHKFQPKYGVEEMTEIFQKKSEKRTKKGEIGDFFHTCFSMGKI